MSDLSVYDSVAKVIRRQSSYRQGDPLELSARLHEDLGFDSLDDVELLMDLEDAFDIDIADSEAESCRTVGDIVELIKRKAGAA